LLESAAIFNAVSKYLTAIAADRAAFDDKNYPLRTMYATA